MPTDSLNQLFSPETINGIFSENLADQFFDALYGDSSEGAYDIGLVFKEHANNTLLFLFFYRPSAYTFHEPSLLEMRLIDSRATICLSCGESLTKKGLNR